MAKQKSKKRQVTYLQGDVPVLPVSATKLKGTKKRKYETMVLRYGEGSGHTHALDTRSNIREDGEGNLFFAIDKGSDSTVLTHNTHHKQKITRKNSVAYQHGKIFEYDPFAEHEREVRD